MKNRWFFLGLNPNFCILTEKIYILIFYKLIAINKTKNLKYKESVLMNIYDFKWFCLLCKSFLYWSCMFAGRKYCYSLWCSQHLAHSFAFKSKSSSKTAELQIILYLYVPFLTNYLLLVYRIRRLTKQCLKCWTFMG